MAYDLDQNYVRARLEVGTANSRRLLQWSGLACNVVMFVIMTAILIPTSTSEFPSDILFTAALGWFLTLIFQLLAVLLGELLNAPDAARVGRILRWQIVTFIGSIVVWLVTARLTNLLLTPKTSREDYFLYWGMMELFGFASFLLPGTKGWRHRVREHHLRNLLAEQMLIKVDIPGLLNQIDPGNGEKPKRKLKRHELAPNRLSDDGESTVPDSAEYLAKTDKRS